jgi:hypothetical protein
VFAVCTKTSQNEQALPIERYDKNYLLKHDYVAIGIEGEDAGNF